MRNGLQVKVNQKHQADVYKYADLFKHRINIENIDFLLSEICK